MKKTETKKTKKAVKPQFIVNLTDVENPIGLYAAFGLAKQSANLPITNAELDAIIAVTTNIAMKLMADSIVENSKSIEITGDEKLVFDVNGKYTIKKPNIFRRFWNWITRKK